MNESILNKLGFHKEVIDIKAGKCPFCKEKVGQFRDALSKREYEISGLCQKCQDEMWPIEKEG